jgi:hypothetical protein
MMVLLAAIIVSAAVAWGCAQIARQLTAVPEEQQRTRALEILTAFAPAIAAAHNDPRTLLVWEPLARAVRQLCPQECAALDRVSGAAFPFSSAVLQDAHARWTADWLTWERTHDAEFKLKAAVAEQDVAQSGGSATARARLDAIETEKLEKYQRRYEEYVRVAKALQGLAGERTPANN